MKKRVLSLVLALVLVLSGCSMQKGLETQPYTEPPTTEVHSETTTAPEVSTPKTDYLEIYRPILDGLTELMAKGTDDNGPKEGQNAVWEVMTGMDSLQTAFSTGYAIQDLSGDGIPELLICDVSRHDGLQAFGSTIYALYTCSGGEPVLCFEGWARNRYSLLQDNTILNIGSGGAMYAIWGIYNLSPDGTELQCLDYFFTHEKDGDFENIAFYHNLTGEWNPDLSEELEMTDEQFWRLQQDAEDRITEISLIPFCEYGYEHFGSFVQAQWLDEVTEKPESYTEFTINEDESQAKLLFTSFGTVRDFRLLSLTFVDMDDSGKMNYDIEEIYALEKLTEDRPLVVGISFFGTIPNNGIRFTNDKGETKTYALHISGENGSVLLTEI